MAVRYISTKLAIEGEAAYRAALTRTNSELKNLQSALKLTESEFKGQSNSIDALRSKGEALSKLHEQQAKKVTELQKALENARKAVDAYADKKEELTKKIAENEKALEKLKNATGDTVEEQERLTAENKELNAELAENEKYLQAAERGTNNWETQLNEAKVELNNLDDKIEENNKHLQEAANSADGCATSIDEFGNKTEAATTSATDLRDALIAAGLIEAIKKVAEAFAECVDAAIEFESGMAGVKKTTNMSEEELAVMADAIQELATRIPATTTEITAVAEAAGQMGIAKGDIVEFSETMLALGVATNLTAEEAATSFARIANITGVTAAEYEKLGSVVVALGNSLPTTEKEITEMANRLASGATIAGLTTQQMFALSAAMSSVGIEAEAGGTAMTQTLAAMEKAVVSGGDKLEKFAQISGISSKEFADAWKNDPITAITAFLTGLGDLESKGESATLVLDEMGLSGIRQSNMLKSLALASDTLTSAVNTASTAWEENTALATEANTRYETTESKLQMLTNAFGNVKIAIGDQLTPALGALADAGTNILNGIADFIESNDAVVPIIAGVVTALGTLVIGVTAATIATTSFGAAIKTATAAMVTNPIFLVVAALAALTVAIATAAASADDGIESVRELTTAASECEAKFAEAEKTFEQTAATYQGNAELARTYVDRLAELESQVGASEEAEKEYATTVDLLRALIPDLNLEIDEQTGLLTTNTNEIYRQIDAWEQYGVQQALHEKYTAQLEAYNDVVAEQYINEAKLTEVKKEHAEIEGQQAEVYEKLNALAEERNAIFADTTLETWEQEAAVAELNMAEQELINDLMLVNDELYANERQQKNLNEAIAEGTAVAEEYRVPVDEARAAMELYEQEASAAAAETEKLAQEQAEAAEAAQRAQEAQNEITASLEDLAQAYRDAYDAAYSSIDGQIGLFDEFAYQLEEDVITMDEAMASWQEQINNLAAYTENLEKAAKYGIDDGLLLSLSDGSAESAAIIAAWVAELEGMGAALDTDLPEDAQTFVDEFNAAFEGTEQAKSAFAETVAAMETDLNNAVVAMEQAANDCDFSGFSDALNTAFANVGVDFESIGSGAAVGLATGINNNAGQVTDAANSMSVAGVDAARAGWDAHSPSQKMVDLGGDVTGGLSTGIENTKDGPVNAVTTMGDEMEQAAVQSMQELVDNAISEFSQISDRTRSELEILRSTIINTMSSMSGDMYSVGSDIVQGMINGLNSRSGSLYSTVSSIVSNAIARAKAEAATASPSKKTTKIFEDVGEGMVVGLENKREKINQTAQSVVNEALVFDARQLTSSFDAAVNGLTVDATPPDTDNIGKLIESINDRAPDLSVPDGTRKTETITMQFGDIIVEVTVQNSDTEQAKAFGITVGEQIKRELRYRGVM